MSAAWLIAGHREASVGLLAFFGVGLQLVASIAVPCGRLHASSVSGFSRRRHRLRGTSLTLAAASIGSVTASTVATYVMLVAPLGLLYAVAPGYLVRQGARSSSIVKGTIVASLVGIPIWSALCLSIVCRKGDC
jgi:hypothetical protein